MARSTSGEVIGLSSRLGGVQLPHGSLRSRTWRSLVSRSPRRQIVGSNPTVLTNNRAEVQMEARLLWEQEGPIRASMPDRCPGSTPKRPTETVVEDWLSGWP